ncbi:MAG: hypothetical protein LBS27_12065 [Bifidobacteriaceae bacterium]|jgi:MFS family permease|nr:hypothetical protein [Bifidobacteriaceae bacterium]
MLTNRAAATTLFVALVYFICGLDAMVTAVAVRVIGEALNSMTGLVWMVAAMLLATAVATPVFGKLADRWGRRKLLAGGLASLIAATAALGLNLRVVPPGRPAAGGQVDWAGSGALVLAVVPVIVGAARWREWGLGDPLPYLLAAGCVAGVALFAWSQRRMGAASVMPRQMLSRQAFKLGLPVAFLASLASAGVASVLPLHWQISRGLTPTWAGIMAFVVVLGTLAGSVAESRFMSLTGRYKAQTRAGLGLMAVTLGVIAAAGAAAPLWFLAIILFVYGAGSVAAIASLEVALIRSLPPSEYATASGAVLLARTMGLACGSAALLGTVFAVTPALVARRLAAPGLAGEPAGGPAGAGAYEIDSADALTSLAALPPAARQGVALGFADATVLSLVICLLTLVAALILIARLPEHRFEPKPPRFDPVWAAKRRTRPGLGC